MSEFDTVLDLDHYGTRWSSKCDSAYIGDVDDATSIYSFSTNATMGDNPEAGLTIDKYFYQPVGRAVEKFALRIAIRLNICHPSPAQIIRVLGLFPYPGFLLGDTRKKPGDVIHRISAEEPSAVPGILSLVEQSQ